MARTPAPGTRRRIMLVASRLFRDHGVRAVGMQQVIDETGLGKSLLYREFPSKDELVAAWLRESDEEWWRIAEDAIDRHTGDPVRRLFALVELTAESARSPGFHGCVFYNTSLEFRDDDHPGRREALAHLRRMRDRLRVLGMEAGAERPDDLADALMLVIGGLYVSAAALGPDGPARVAVSTAETLIREHCPVPAAAGA
ncbi:TetR family transcriptional regulator [Sphaerisporangium rufum]|uniref:TetR family transcriptional regulator n=1 Tax=Sphaerisporangium rufum TaxID=1381558 RepID=A0A919R0K0_9ACTN|nr:TetR/AcrR family transcriptional regulator [Sphaerisporangium rufum]GII76195.1 TetR family transcriptional regulator [Sphaerisporangium rufum]